MPIRRVAVAATPHRYGFGVTRVSKLGKRERGKIVTEREQEERIRAEAARQDIEILKIFSEMDISGRKPLDRRPGLKEAVERIERGEAQVLVGAYFDRLVRNTTVKREIVERIESTPNGGVLAVDFGFISHKNSSHWVTSELVAVLAEHYARQIGEKTKAARVDALDRGLVTFPNIPLGYRKINRGLVKDEAAAPLVVESFHMRARGATLQQIQDYLLEHGVKRTYRQVQLMFGLEVYLGYMIEHTKEGDVVSDDTHEALVDKPLWQSVQGLSAKRGRPASEPRLLSKLDVATCGACGGHLFVGFKGSSGKRWPMYRCAAHLECPHPVTISAVKLDAAVEARARQELARIRPGMASSGNEVAAAEAVYAAAQEDLEQTVRNLKGIEARSVREVLEEKQQAVKVASQHLQKVRAAAGPLELLRGDQEWDDLTPGGQRALLRAIFARVVVAPATTDGSRERRATGERISFELA